MSKAITLPFELVKDDESLPLHNLFHRRGLLATAQALSWFALAGVELQKQKKKIGHGNWEKWVGENCEYSIRSAQQYMIVAEKVKGRALKTQHAAFLKLLEKSVVDLTPAEQRETIETVMSLTDGETLRELCQPLLKLPAGAGLKDSKRKHTAAGNVNDPEEEAADIWKPHIDFVEKDGVDRRSWKDLPGDEYERLRSAVVDLARLMKPRKKS